MNLDPAIRPAGADDAPALHEAIARLAEHLGVPASHRASVADYARHGPGGGELFHALVAEAAGTTCGVATYLPEFSTLRGRPGVFLQDLWVAPDRRGSGLGRRLLAVVAHRAAAWEAAYLTLSVNVGNAGAVAFYRRLGFEADDAERRYVLEGPAYTRLEEAR